MNRNIVQVGGKWLGLLGSLALVACQAEGPAPAVDALSFEKEYVKTLDGSDKTGIRLIGFKTMTIPKDQLEAFDATVAQQKAHHPNYLWDKSTGTLRVYFPVESALVEMGSRVNEATTKGELAVTMPSDGLQTPLVLGRRQTEHVTGVEGNIIKDGIIYLAEKNPAIRHFDNVFVFDFGIKLIMVHEHATAEPREYDEKGKVSCVKNHGGVNCSTAFGISKGRCPFDATVCMDYNGWFTDCKNGSLLNFPGSDCDYALGAGHCWNEIM